MSLAPNRFDPTHLIDRSAALPVYFQVATEHQPQNRCRRVEAWDADRRNSLWLASTT